MRHDQLDVLPDERFITTNLHHRRKLHLAHTVRWDHHRGGWPDVTDFVDQHLGHPDGTLTVNALEETIATGRVLDVPWVAFSHEVAHHGYDFPDLARLVRLPTWKASVRKCRGLWVLSRHNKAFFESMGLPFPVSAIKYPTTFPDQQFSAAAFNKGNPRNLVSIGAYLRNVDAFYALDAPGYMKLQLRPPGLDWLDLPGSAGREVSVLSDVTDSEYDALLSRSIVFLNLEDAGANTTIVECIARGTPVVVNKVGGVSEYLGECYPLYYDDLEEAAAKLADLELIATASRYLRQPSIRRDLTFSAFRSDLQNTAVYRSLPVPASTRSVFRRFEMTVLICTYRRIGCLADQLRRLADQDFERPFEVIIWNNNPSAQVEVGDIADSFAGDLVIRVMHSSENLYCAIRFAVHAFMRSEVLMICDDDVQPGPGYLRRFWEKHSAYGARSVISARGHTFLPHDLDTDHPERVWREQTDVQFHGETAEDKQIHFFHADNCLIPRALLKDALALDLDRPDFILVDDYWLSFMLSHRCRAQLWKIKSDDVFSYHPSAEDARIALFRSSRVREERVNLYIHHMRQGWPFAREAHPSATNTRAAGGAA